MSSVTEREIINALIERVEILEDKVRYLESDLAETKRYVNFSED